MENLSKEIILNEYGTQRGNAVIEAAEHAVKFKFGSVRNMILFKNRTEADKWSHFLMKAGVVHNWIGDDNPGFHL